MNVYEQEIKRKLEEQGIKVLRNGWPDFLCQEAGGEVFAVEVKRKNDTLSAQQQAVHHLLKKTGLFVYVIGEERPKPKYLDSDRENKLLLILLENPNTTMRTLAKKSGIPRVSCWRILKKLEKDKLVRRWGHKQWRLTTQGNATATGAKNEAI